MQSTIIIILYTIAISNAQTIYSYTSQNRAPTTSNIVCPDNIPCYVYCTGILACWGNNNALQGPMNAPLSIIVDSQFNSSAHGTNAFVFSIRSIYCMECTSLSIVVKGGGYGEFHNSYIGGPTNGLTTIDCSGDPVYWPTAFGPISYWKAPCYSMWFNGEKGFGTGPGQVYVKDVTSTPGRIDITRMAYKCLGPFFPIQCRGDLSGQGMQWSHTSLSYLECANITALPCQVTRSPTPAPTIPIINKIDPIKSKHMYVLGGDSEPGFDTVSLEDYIIKGCMIIVIFGFCIGIIRVVYVVCIMNRRDRERIHSYSKVKPINNFDEDDIIQPQYI